MKLKTHMLIARKIHEHMEEKYGIKLKKRHFVFGSIKPDLARKFKALHHSIHDSLDFVLDEIDRHEHESHTIKRPSVHLGTLSHYMSDFFCSKHYYRNDGEGLIKHIKYEGLLQKKIKMMDEANELSLPYLHIADDLSGDFLDILRALEDEYVKQPPSIENDIMFALFAPLTVCKFMFKDLISEPEAVRQAA